MPVCIKCKLEVDKDYISYCKRYNLSLEACTSNNRRLRMVRYKILIQKIETEQGTKTEYTKTGKRPYSKEDLNDSFNKASYDGKEKEIWENVEVNYIRRIETELYKQELEQINLLSIIKAVNDM